MNTEISSFKNAVANELFGISIREAVEKGVCVECKQFVNFYPPEQQELAHYYMNYEKSNEGDIWTWEGASEYQISGLCEHCFEKIFENSED